MEADRQAEGEEVMARVPGAGGASTGRVNKPSTSTGRPLTNPAAPAAKKPGSTGMKQQIVQKAQPAKPKGMKPQGVKKTQTIKRTA